MFNWFKKDVISESDSCNLSDSQFNYLVSLLKSGDLKISTPSGSNFFTIDVGNIQFSGMSNFEHQIRVYIEFEKITIDGYKASIMHKHCMDAINSESNKKKEQSQSRAIKKLNELMNG